MVNIKYIGFLLFVGLFGKIIRGNNADAIVKCKPNGEHEEMDECFYYYLVNDKLYDCTDEENDCKEIEKKIGFFLSEDIENDDEKYIICSTTNGININCEVKDIVEKCSVAGAGKVIEDINGYKLCIDDTDDHAIEIFEYENSTSSDANSTSNDGKSSSNDGKSSSNDGKSTSNDENNMEKLYFIPGNILNKSLDNKKYYVVRSTENDVIPLNFKDFKKKYMYSKKEDSNPFKVLSGFNECPADNDKSKLVEYTINEDNLTYTSE